MQRMRMCLQNYNILITHINGTEMYFADALSRAHSTNTQPRHLFDTEVAVEAGDIESNLAEQIRKGTLNDECLQEI